MKLFHKEETMKVKQYAAWLLSAVMLLNSTLPAYATIAGNGLDNDIVSESEDEFETATDRKSVV